MQLSNKKLDCLISFVRFVNLIPNFHLVGRHGTVFKK